MLLYPDIEVEVFFDIGGVILDVSDLVRQSWIDTLTIIAQDGVSYDEICSLVEMVRSSTKGMSNLDRAREFLDELKVKLTNHTEEEVVEFYCKAFERYCFIYGKNRVNHRMAGMIAELQENGILVSFITLGDEALGRRLISVLAPDLGHIEIIGRLPYQNWNKTGFIIDRAGSQARHIVYVCDDTSELSALSGYIFPIFYKFHHEKASDIEIDQLQGKIHSIFEGMRENKQ